MPILGNELDLERCPHCGRARPSLPKQHQISTTNSEGKRKRFWCIYACRACGGLILAASVNLGVEIAEQYPRVATVSSDIPERAREYLRQARESLGSPAGAMMLAASAVDAMLKAKGFVTGSLYARIDQATKQHVITEDMAKWAHQVRLDANDQRHSDEAVPLPSVDDATRAVEFASAISQFMFVIPAMVSRGIADSGVPEGRA